MAKVYRLYDASKNSIKESRDVLLDENVSKNLILEEDAVQRFALSTTKSKKHLRKSNLMMMNIFHLRRYLTVAVYFLGSEIVSHYL